MLQLPIWATICALRTEVCPQDWISQGNATSKRMVAEFMVSHRIGDQEQRRMDQFWSNYSQSMTKALDCVIATDRAGVEDRRPTRRAGQTRARSQAHRFSDGLAMARSSMLSRGAAFERQKSDALHEAL